jgi:hypothetical protein
MENETWISELLISIASPSSVPLICYTPLLRDYLKVNISTFFFLNSHAGMRPNARILGLAFL